MKHLFCYQTVAALMVVLSCGLLRAQGSSVPVIRTFSFADRAFIGAMSDNGHWAIAKGTSQSAGIPKIVNIDTQEWQYLGKEDLGQQAYDVTDDGKIAVGTINGLPAYYKVDKGEWVTLPIGSTEFTGGSLAAVTPDGHYAVGRISPAEAYTSGARMWDLTTNKCVELPNLPTVDCAGEVKDQAELTAISADGRYLLGRLSWSYPPMGDYAGGSCTFVYDRQNDTYKMMGYSDTSSIPWTTTFPEILFVDGGCMSCDGHYVAGDVYLKSGDSSYSVPYRYDVYTDELLIMDDAEVRDTYSSAVSNKGVVSVATPAGSPVRSWYVRHGNYWYSFNQILSQKYNMDFSSRTSFDNTGTVVNISADGRSIAAFPDPYNGYVAIMPDAIENVCEGINLLAAVSCDPVPGSIVSSLSTVTITFGHNLQLLGKASQVKICNEDGSDYKTAFSLRPDGKNLTIIFRGATLEAGKNYYLSVPEGVLCIDGDPEQTNPEIRIPYQGRSEGNVKMKSVTPSDNSALAKFDYNTNPVMMSFDATIKLVEGAQAYLYSNNDPEPVCNIMLAVSGNNLALYPVSTQYLFEGSTYRLVLPAGSVTDLAGNGPNDEISVTYRGTYVREVSADDIYLFSDDFSNGLNNFMLFDADRLEPGSEMKAWAFTSNMAWNFARDDNSMDLAACSHSMYSPSGKSEDWMVTPQIYIPDNLCRFTFDSQSYRKNKQDRLKVYVWESNTSYNTLTADIVARIKAEGKVLYDELQTPGEREDVLEGEWKENSVSLAEYAGKNVYIAFLNDNENQSVVFVDNVNVLHEMHYLVSLTSPTSVVGQDEVTVTGTIVGNNNDKAYDTVTLTLVDAEGNTVDTYKASGLNLAKGKSHSFTFAKPLPLEQGADNKFTIKSVCDDENAEMTSSVKALLFRPTKRVVLEEYTGRDCSNCPLGLLSIEKMEQRFGDRFIPLGLHCYNSDPLGYGIESYPAYLGLTAAPSGVINRGAISQPSFLLSDKLYFSVSELPEGTTADPLWLDLAAKELEEPAYGEVTVVPTYDPSNKTMVNMSCDVRFALTAKDQNIGLFALLVQDNTSSYQRNNYGSFSDPSFGEFGSNGIYSAAIIYPFVHNDVVRSYAGTFNGQVGLIPQNLEAGQVYNARMQVPVPEDVQDYLSDCKGVVMMIDSNTGRVINAASAKMSDSAAVGAVDATSAITITYVDGQLVVCGKGSMMVNAFTASGSMISAATGTDSVIIPLDGYTGILIVKAIDERGSKVSKIVVR